MRPRRPDPPQRSVSNSQFEDLRGRGSHKEASYYGPEFQGIEQGRSGSITGPIEYPEEPKQWERHPENPWPADVKHDYDCYKYHATPIFDAANNTYKANAQKRLPYEEEERLEHYKGLRKQAELAGVEANRYEIHVHSFIGNTLWQQANNGHQSERCSRRVRP